MSDRRQPARQSGPDEDDDGSGPMTAALPGSIAAAWGLRERPGKGPKRGLSLPQIVQAGRTAAAADGLGAVSMSRVATELGVGTMSLYRYVESKQELLDLMVDSALGPPPAARAGAAGGTGWPPGRGPSSASTGTICGRCRCHSPGRPRTRTR